MRCHVARLPGYWILKCDWSTSGLLPGPIPEVISAVKSGMRSVILNLENVEYINSIGVKSIIDSIKFSIMHEVDLSLCCPTPFVRRALKINGLSGDVPIYDSELKAKSRAEKASMEIVQDFDFFDRILVIQNKIEIARDLRKACCLHRTKPKFKLVPVRSMNKAIHLLNCDRLDCILVDAAFHLFQVTRLIEETLCSLNRQEIPILLVSSEKYMPMANKMIQHGATDIIRHPFNHIDVITRIQTQICYNKDWNKFIPANESFEPAGFALH